MKKESKSSHHLNAFEKHNSCRIYVISRTASSGQCTVQLAYKRWPPLLRKVDGHIVDRSPGQGDADADQGVNGVSVQRHDDQEEAAQAVDKREEQGQLWRDRRHTGS